MSDPTLKALRLRDRPPRFRRPQLRAQIQAPLAFAQSLLGVFALGDVEADADMREACRPRRNQPCPAH